MSTAEPREEGASLARMTQARGRRMLLLVAALFLVPLAVAFALYYGSDWRPGHRTNHGDLIVPARPLPATALAGMATGPLFRGKWSLVYVGGGACDAACAEVLVTMRQTRLALASEMGRVQRVFITTGAGIDREQLEREYPGLLVLEPDAPLVAVFPAERRPKDLFIVDPLGNLMLRFDTRANPKGLLQDLKKLLTLSQIG